MKHIDPVCKMLIEEGKEAAQSEYKGNKYYFCSKGCQIVFDKDPGKYIGDSCCCSENGGCCGQ